MPFTRFVLAATAALALGGCWTNTCEDWYPGTTVDACWQELDGLFLPGPYHEDGDGLSDCGGVYRIAEDCRSLGYSNWCGDEWWVRPEDARVCGG